MRRFPVVFLAVCASAVAACNIGGTNAGGGAQEEGGPPPGPATANVHVFCNDTTGPGIGARIGPWQVHTRGARQVTFNIRPTPGKDTIRTTLDSVLAKSWAFQDSSYQSSDTTFTAQIATALIDSLTAAASRGTEYSDTTYYRLTLVCPTGTTIAIDPIVIVDQ